MCPRMPFPHLMSRCRCSLVTRYGRCRSRVRGREWRSPCIICSHLSLSLFCPLRRSPPWKRWPTTSERLAAVQEAIGRECWPSRCGTVACGVCVIATAVRGLGRRLAQCESILQIRAGPRHDHVSDGSIAWKGAPLSRVANVNPSFNGLATATLLPASQPGPMPTRSHGALALRKYVQTAIGRSSLVVRPLRR